MNYKIALCDDCEADRAYVLPMVERWAEASHHTVCTEVFPSAESFLFRHPGGGDCDILLLDIEMGKMDGVTLAKSIRQTNEAVQIVFLTGFADYIGEGYEVAALHYLMKPIRRDKLFDVLDRAVTALRKAGRTLLLPVEGETLRLILDRVEYVEAFSHTVCVVTENETLQVKKPISEMETLLGADFLRCHRSYLVHIAHIARLSKTEVFLDSGKVLPLSRAAAPAVHKAFVTFYTGENNETL